MYNPFIRFNAWRLGVSPESVARYGDRGLSATLFKYIGIGITTGLVGVSLAAETQHANRALECSHILDQNRKAFYGKDFHSPKDAAIQANLSPSYGNNKDTPMYVDKKTGLIMDGKGNLIAPAAHERSLMLSELNIEPASVDKIANLREKVLQRDGQRWS